jgi:hypothetical protein
MSTGREAPSVNKLIITIEYRGGFLIRKIHHLEGGESAHLG